MHKYVLTPESISFNQLVNNNYTLSPSIYKALSINNSNCKPVRAFLSRKLTKKDLGQDVGSINYISHSTHFFLRTKALKQYSYIPEFTSESLIPIFPSSFIPMNLKEGDILISKDSNIGEIVYVDKDYPNISLSGAIYRLPIENHKLYLLAFIKHSVFREQLDYMVPKGATIRHAKTLFLDCLIPLPNQNIDDTISYIEKLTYAIIEKEKLIRQRLNDIISTFQSEISENQGERNFEYSFPTISFLENSSRIDAKFYSFDFRSKYFAIANYSNGTCSIDELGFRLSRGQNLQVSNIGESVYSQSFYPNFYSLVLPKFISVYGIPNKIEYLGNPNSLKTLNRGDLIFGAEGFEKGRSFVVVEPVDRFITNIHGITITHKDGINLSNSIFLKCYLDYLRSIDLIECFSVGGNGGSFAQKYWDSLLIPKFPSQLIEKITSLYYTGLDFSTLCPETNEEQFFDSESQINSKSGIYELYKAKNRLQSKLDMAIQCIIDDMPVNIDYNVYKF